MYIDKRVFDRAFDPFVESMNNRFQWQEDSRNPEVITVMYAGTIAMSMIYVSRMEVRELS